MKKELQERLDLLNSSLQTVYIQQEQAKNTLSDLQNQFNQIKGQIFEVQNLLQIVESKELEKQEKPQKQEVK